MVLKRAFRWKETSPVYRVETGHGVCTGYHSCTESNVVALSWSKQEGILAQERKGFGLPYQHLQPLAWLVEGLQAVEVGVLVEDELKSHVCANTRLVYPLFFIRSFLLLQLFHQARELSPSLLT